MARKQALERGQQANHSACQGAGLMDEEFFMYGEDLDWCYRIQKAGWKIYYTPATQIIHYKGASTRKSELRYVRLFHGAMLRFADKHLQQDYPRFFLWGLRLAVIARGTVAAIASWLRHPSLADVVSLTSALTLLGWYRSSTLESGFPLPFYLIIAPGFAVTASAVVGAMGGYKGRAIRFGPVLVGITVAVCMLATVSFFIKQIAFSRLIVLAGLPAGLLVLGAVRLIRRSLRPVRGRTILVGDTEDIAHLVKTLHPKLSFVGFVSNTRNSTPNTQNGIPRLGSTHQLRDIVKLYSIRDVIFSASSLSNKEIFALLRRLQGVRVQRRILAADASGVTEHNSALLQAEDAIGSLHGSSRIFGALTALVGAAAHPLVVVAARTRGGKWTALAERTRQWPDVLLGRRPLVGFKAGGVYVPSEDWGLREGVFAVTDALDPNESTDAEQAYWYYVRNQSVILDWIIIMRAVRLMR